jgi:hypothetical protein
MKHELYQDMLGTPKEPVFCDNLREAIRAAAVSVKQRSDDQWSGLAPRERLRDEVDDFEEDIRQAFADSLKIRATPAEQEADRKSEATAEGRLLNHKRTNFHE